MSIARFPFWRCAPEGGEGRYVFPVTRPATVGPPEHPHVMGGAALAATIDALEQDSGQPILWANTQFLSPTQGVEELIIQCEPVGGGRSVSQWAAIAFAGERPVHRVNAALGARPGDSDTQFAQMPDVPGPADGEAKPSDPNGYDDNLVGQLERRTALEDNVRGYEAVWSRSAAGFSNDAGWLAMVSDFFLGAHPRTRGGSSLDATFRFIRAAEPGWILSVTEFAAFDRGVVHGSARHFAEDGTLLAISSQTGVLPHRPFTP
ncbi:MAG: hypothetical protein CMN71_09570 [Sphingomonadaceae bacterium]|nr:hypothetical protein [Sphingomonadaceae bacterium]